MKRTAVIMAGGSGERFWPLSRIKKPKQLLNLATDKTMIEDSIERISPLIPSEDVFIITSQTLLEPMRKALQNLPPENIVAEPLKRNTAPCLALAAAFIAERYKEEDINQNEISVAVLTADQSIYPMDSFVKTVGAALNYVETHNVLATIGIQPDRPETGYGYIELEKPFDKKSAEAEIKPVIRFCEKPNAATAQKFLDDGNYLWNSGMFFWRLDTFINKMINHLPEVGSKISEMQDKYKRRTRIEFPEALDKITPLFEQFPNISIDYGLMEKSRDVVVVKALFNWDDIGSWDSLDRVRQVQANGNIVEGDTALIEVKNSVVINASQNKKMIIAGVALDNVVIVLTDDAVLVTQKQRVQDVKKCVDLIRSQNGEKWL